MEQAHTPHVVILPFPAQGHVKPMLRLAVQLSHSGFQVTFINSDHNHARLLHSIDIQNFYSRLPGFRFVSLPDGLPPEHPRTGRLITDLFASTISVTKPLFRKLLNSIISKPTCIIADGIMSFAIDIAQELRIPVITFRTLSASSTWIYFHISKLIQDAQIPFQGDKDVDRPITSVPGFECLLRCRDLPNFCRLKDVQNPTLQFFLSQTSAMTRASALILNTFQELEAPIISRLASIFPKIYTIGPLHALYNSHTIDSSPSISSDGSLWKQDRRCMTWLDSQPSKSVVYVSFGSLVMLTGDQLLEAWYGLVNSGKPFLWVIRPDSIAAGEKGVSQIPAELVEGIKERECIVGWAPQEEVLAHPAIGGFFTHSGWNSTLESIFAGVPMLCWPQIAEQNINSRCVSELWKVGLDMKDATCDRLTVEMMVRDLMEGKREEIMKSVDEIAGMARQSVLEGGSSYCNFEKLIGDIRFMCLTKLQTSTSD